MCTRLHFSFSSSPFVLFLFLFSSLLFHSISSSDDICSLALSPLNTSHTSPMMMISLTRGSSSDTRYPFIHFFLFFSFIYLFAREEGRRGGGRRREEGGGGRREEEGGGGRRRGEDDLERQSLLCWYLCYLYSSISPHRRKEGRKEANKQWILRM